MNIHTGENTTDLLKLSPQVIRLSPQIKPLLTHLLNKN